MENEDLLGKALEESLTNFDLSKIAVETVDSAVEFLTDVDIVEMIPIVKHLYSGYKTFTKFQERAEIKKLLIFFSELNKIPKEKRIGLVNKIDGDEKYKKQTFERVALILGRLDEAEKAQIIGKLFRNKLLGNLNQETFFRLSFAVEKTFLNSLKSLRVLVDQYKVPTGANAVWISNQFKDPLVNKELAYVGLMIETIKTDSRKAQIRARSMGPSNAPPDYEFDYKISALGEKLVKFGLY